MDVLQQVTGIPSSLKSLPPGGAPQTGIDLGPLEELSLPNPAVLAGVPVQPVLVCFLEAQCTVAAAVSQRRGPCSVDVRSKMLAY